MYSYIKTYGKLFNQEKLKNSSEKYKCIFLSNFTYIVLENKFRS